MEWTEAIEKAVGGRDPIELGRALSAAGTPVDGILAYGNPLVCWLARQGWAEGIEVLLAAGSKPSALPQVLHHGIFPTYVTGTDVRPLELLIDAGADVNAISEANENLTPLQYAALVPEERGEAITRLLLARGAQVGLRAPRKDPPLHMATQRPAVGTVRALLEAGADPNEVDCDGASPLRGLLAELRGALDRERELQDGSGPIACDFVPRSMAALIEHGADATERNADGRSLLWLALAMASCPGEVMEALIDGGARCDETMPFRDEALDMLAMADLRGAPASVLRRLMAAGCPVDVEYDALGGSFLASVARFRPEVALQLWDGSADFGDQLVAYRAQSGVTALAYAAIGATEGVTPDQEALVRRLHASGSSLKEVTTTGKTMLEVVQSNQPAIVPLLRELLASEPT